MRPPEDWKKARLTLGICLATALAWLLAQLFARQDWLSVWGGFIPARLALGGDEMLAPFWLTPLTATLLHGGIVHLLFNLVVLAFCGRQVEWALGWPGVALLYLLGAYAAAGAQYLVDPLSTTPMIGASGAISAVLGAYAMLFGRNKVKVDNPVLARWLNALWLMAAWIVLQIFVGIALRGGSFIGGEDGGIQVAVAAHIGGFVVGVLLANPLLLFKYRKA